MPFLTIMILSVIAINSPNLIHGFRTFKLIPMNARLSATQNPLSRGLNTIYTYFGTSKHPLPSAIFL